MSNARKLADGIKSSADAMAITIDNSENIGVGVNDPDATLDVSGGSNKLGILRVTQRLSGAAAYGLDVGLDPTYGDPVFSRIVNDTVTEAMRIQRSSGNLFVNATASKSGIARAFIEYSNMSQYGLELHATAASSAGQLIFYVNNNNVGGVISNTTSTAYNTSSDYRLKENVTDVTDGITRVKQLAPKRFNFIADADTTIDGFIAHEAATVVPEAVTGTKDAVEVWKDGEELPDGASVGDNKLDDNGKTIPVMQGIDQAKLVPLLTAALQEAIAKIETLETKVAALGG